MINREEIKSLVGIVRESVTHVKKLVNKKIGKDVLALTQFRVFELRGKCCAYKKIFRDLIINEVFIAPRVSISIFQIWHLWNNEASEKRVNDCKKLCTDFRQFAEFVVAHEVGHVIEYVTGIIKEHNTEQSQKYADDFALDLLDIVKKGWPHNCEVKKESEMIESITGNGWIKKEN